MGEGLVVLASSLNTVRTMAIRDIYETGFDEDVRAESSASRCPECDGRVATNAVETVCEDCGLVIDEQRTDHGPEWQAYDDVVAPTELQLSLSNRLVDAERARLDIQWSELGMYAFHYSDSDDVNWRVDRHPNTHSPESYFHPPPAAATTDAGPSCIDVTEVSLVTRAVHAMWRAAYEDDNVGQLNSASNPP